MDGRQSENGVLLVQMAQMCVVRGERRIKTTLGSCVGVVLHDAERGVAGLAHIMLPRRFHSDESVGKYADTALPALLSEVVRRGASRPKILAYIAGGADMFPSSSDDKIATIGRQNIEAVRRILDDLGITIAKEDTGGIQGRTLLFNSATGHLEVRSLRPWSWNGGQK